MPGSVFLQNYVGEAVDARGEDGPAHLLQQFLRQVMSTSEGSLWPPEPQCHTTAPNTMLQAEAPSHHASQEALALEQPGEDNQLGGVCKEHDIPFFYGRPTGAKSRYFGRCGTLTRKACPVTVLLGQGERHQHPLVNADPLWLLQQQWLSQLEELPSFWNLLTRHRSAPLSS